MATYDQWKLASPPEYEVDDSLTLKQKRDIVITELDRKIRQLERELGIYITEIETDSEDVVGVEIEER